MGKSFYYSINPTVDDQNIEFDTSESDVIWCIGK